MTDDWKSKYDNVDSFSEGLARVKLNGKWGFIDNTGKKVIPLKYDLVGNFSEGLVVVKLNDKYGFVNRKGVEVVPCEYDLVGNFSEGCFDFYSDGRPYFPPIYYSAWPFYPGLAVVKLNDKYGFVDKTGKKVIPLKYDKTEYFREGLARVQLNGKIGYVDTIGHEYWDMTEDEARQQMKNR